MIEAGRRGRVKDGSAEGSRKSRPERTEQED